MFSTMNEYLFFSIFHLNAFYQWFLFQMYFLYLLAVGLSQLSIPQINAVTIQAF